MEINTSGLLLAATLAWFGAGGVEPPSRIVTYVAGARGINAHVFDAATGGLTPIAFQPYGGSHTSGSTPRIAVHPSGRYLYCTTGTAGGGRGDPGTLHVFAIASDGRLVNVESVSSWLGRALLMHPSGRSVYVLNGDLTRYSIHPETGRLALAGATVPRVFSSVGAAMDPWGEFLWIRDRTYMFDENGASPTTVGNAGGAGIAMFAVDGRGERVFGGREAPDELLSFAVHRGTGALTLLDRAPTRRRIAEVATAGRFLYVATGNDASTNDVSAWEVDDRTGALSAIGDRVATVSDLFDGQKLAVDPSHRFLFVVHERNVVSYEIDVATGLLSSRGVVDQGDTIAFVPLR
jgi:6-phosphogluconolactonase (cycloisomerase 2 family)